MEEGRRSGLDPHLRMKSHQTQSAPSLTGGVASPSGDTGNSPRGLGNEDSEDGAPVVNSETGDSFPQKKSAFWGSFSYLPVPGRAVAELLAG